MRHRIATTIAALAITGSLAAGGAAIANAATSSTSSTAKTTQSAPTTPLTAPGGSGASGAHASGTHTCPNMGSTTTGSYRRLAGLPARDPERRPASGPWSRQDAD
jgi:hypothetical protein